MTDQKICVGAIAGAYGVQGEVRLKSYCAEPTGIADYEPLTSEDGSQTFQITLTRAIKNGLAVKLTGVSTKEEADALKGVQLFVDRDVLPSLPDDEYYHSDLMGLHVLDTGGNPLGTVVNVLNHGAGDLLEIKSSAQSDTILMPFSLAVVPTVDLETGRIIADPPAGLFPDE
ncbi:MAG: ribosome maturation factor RimM [Pseudoruegeria sp.]